MTTMPAGNLIGGNLVTPDAAQGISPAIAPNLADQYRGSAPVANASYRTSDISHSGAGAFNIFSGGTKSNTLWCETLMIPTGIDAVQICPLNNVADVSTYTGILAYVQTSDLSGAGSDLKNPYFSGAVQSMQQVTWAGGNSPTFPSGAAAQLPNGPWSDWIPVVNTGNNGPSYLLLRVWYPNTVAAGGGYMMVNQQGGRVAKLQALGSNGFYGTAASNVGASNSASLSSAGAAMPILVRFATRKKLVSVGQYGDSTRQGYYGDGIVAAAERYAIARSLAGKPTAISNRGITGQTTTQYLARLQSDIAAGEKFDVLIWQVASPNDGFSAAVSATQINNAHAAIRIAEQIGAKIVLDGPFPMTATTPTANQSLVVNNAKAFCQAMDKIRPGITSIFYDELHMQNAYGRWISSYNQSGDGLHENELAITSVILPNMTAGLDAIMPIVGL